MKTALRERAITLRRSGKSYREILTQIPVSKSTLSLWLRSVALAKKQTQRITEKRIQAALRGARARKDMRISEVQHFNRIGRLDVGALSARELWLVATALYWGEGSKQNVRSPSARVVIGNSDYRILALFLRWLRHAGIQDSQLDFELYIHQDRKDEQEAFRAWWAERLAMPLKKISKTYYKKGNPRTNRSNVGDLYHGLLRIKVRMSTRLNRQIHGWIEGMSASLGSGVTGNTSAFEAEDSRIVP